MRFRITTLLTVAATAGVIAACGGSNKPPSKSDYVARADKVCSKAANQLDAAGKKFGSAPSLADLVKFRDLLVKGLQDEVKQVRTFTTPKGDAATLNTIYTDVLAVATSIHAAQPGHISDVLHSPAEAHVVKEATDYGFRSCGH